MKCPNCNETLLISERNNVEIDYCPSCRGVWLDRGELDKMLEFAERKYQASQAGYGVNQKPYQEGEYRRHPNEKPYKKKSFLGDFFDFD